ncbi:MAG TPA: methyltransferase domain-containing protein [Gaiellaceae bacterium]|nr:methyltransferase domain-containing protein [Gaiellaceae bacterium]
MSVREAARAGWSRTAGLYERARPEHADGAVAWLVERCAIGPGTVVVELGAGTGKLTRRLVPTGARVLAVEPVAAMLAELERAVPEAEPLAALAQALPLADGVADAVVVANAFHWFAEPAAIAEIARVLRPGGVLGLAWNLRDESDPLQARLTRLLGPLLDESSRLLAAWRPALEASPAFGPLEESLLRHEQRLGRRGLRRRVETIAYVAELPRAEREELLDRVEALAGEGELAFRYVVELYAAERLRPA